MGTVAVLAADVRVGAAVPPWQPLELPADGECPGIEINVLPLQPKRFTLTEPQGQGNTPPSAVTPRCGQPEDAQRFIKGQWLDLVMAGKPALPGVTITICTGAGADP